MKIFNEWLFGIIAMVLMINAIIQVFDMIVQMHLVEYWVWHIVGGIVGFGIASWICAYDDTGEGGVYGM